MTECVLRKFTEDRIARVSREWDDISGGDEFEVELAPLFAWCSTHIDHQDGDAHALELFEVSEGETVAILEMVNARGGALTKLLKLHPSPKYWAVDSEHHLFDELIQVYISAFFNVITHGADAGANEVKIYGRNDSMFRILKRIDEVWVDEATGWTANMQGRWLSIART